MCRGWVYLLANRYRGTIYTGVTADLAQRAWQHRDRNGSQFAARYQLTRLVHAEEYPTIVEAIEREKAIKKWRRAWKIERIESENPAGMTSTIISPDRKEAGSPLARG